MTGTAIVTGAARGIGAAMARRFADAGWRCVAVDVDPRVTELLPELQALAPDSSCVVADISTPDGVATVVRDIPSEPQRLALVNNAGITRDATLAKMDRDNFRSVLRVNLRGPILLCDSLSGLMAEGSAIINVSSKSANGNFGQFNYAISKAGLLGLTRSLALQLAPRVRVNAIAPAFIATDMTNAIPEHLRLDFISRIPLGRAGEPPEVAEVALWLASPESSYVTGQVLAVCGGRSFGPNHPRGGDS